MSTCRRILGSMLVWIGGIVAWIAVGFIWWLSTLPLRAMLRHGAALLLGASLGYLLIRLVAALSGIRAV